MEISELQVQLSEARAEENYNEQAKACRKLLFNAAVYIYEKKNKTPSKNATLYELLDGKIFVEYIGADNDDLLTALHYARIIGTHAEHGDSITKKKANIALENVSYLVHFINNKEQGNAVPPKGQYMSERETRRQYIDVYLEEAGWKVLEKKNIILPDTAGIEIRVEGMPNNKEEGFCDYVLYGRDGKPLAIVEAKKTSIDAAEGKVQVKKYADCMEKQYGYRPVQYYTNGYQIYIIDEIYPDNRKLRAFHTREELELMIKRRNRHQITDMAVNPNITDRAYQQKAITKVCERLNDKKRRALLVMATGTGKTRVSISLVDVLTRETNGWVKNVLFLADRVTLVHQAKQNFEKLLPSMTVCELSGNNDKDFNARLMFCTYQTMIRYIDADEKIFSSGRFDLIIIDEAHRSIFNKYGAIFKYFDCLLVGLTATPKREIHASTYELFGCDEDMPTDSYSMDDAIEEHYLVGPLLVKGSSALIDQGIKYDELTEEQKEQFDEYFEEDEVDPDTVIEGNKIFTELYNKDTCKKVLDELMTKGIKTDGGEQIGKTIIFAYNHKHAKMIEECFKEVYTSNTSDDTCQLVDNTLNYANTLVIDFQEKTEFRVAVSVDMMDTGVDVPEVVNLVFFKPVKSHIKFQQMIGRGTRLCEDLFGPGKDKTHFLIFDYCRNFEWFGEHPEGTPGYETYSLSQRLFDTKVEVLYSLQKVDYQLDADYKAYYEKLKNDLYNDVVEIKKNGSKRIQVREEMAHVDKFCDLNTWASLSYVDIKKIKKHISPLLDGGLKGMPEAVSFDVSVYRIENALLSKGDLSLATSDVKRIKKIATFLIEKRASVDRVLKQVGILKEIQTDAFWTHIDALKLEAMRLEIRGLMDLTHVDRKHVPIDIPDLVTTEAPVAPDVDFDIRDYKQKVIDYLYENLGSAAISKIYNLEPINNDDLAELEKILWTELGTKEDYMKATKQENMAAFVRSLTGLNQDAVNKKFGEYITGTQYNSRQQEFIKSIISYVRQNGDIVIDDVVNNEPFSSYDLLDIFGDEISIVKDVVTALHSCIEAA